MKKVLRNVPGQVILILIVVMALVSQRAYAVGTSVVTSESTDWGFFQETPTGSGSFVPGPAAPPLGSGSAQFTVNGTGGEIFGTFAFAGTRLDAITSLAYSTYRSSGGSALAASLQLDIDTDVTDANTSWQGRLVYEPYYTHSVSTGEWQTWDPLDNAGTGNWWFSGAPGNTKCPMSNPCAWSEVLVNFPNAGVRSAGPNTGTVQFKAGGGWAGGFVGSVDAFSIGVNGEVSTYDFEELPAPAILHVVKLVVNSSGGVAIASDFNIHLKNDGIDVTGSPALGISTPGILYTLSPGTYTVDEDANASYVQSFSTDCPNGIVTLASGDNKICTVVNTDIPPPAAVVAAPVSSGGGGSGGRAVPLMGITKVPSPLALSSGSGPVTYNYTVWNFGGPQTLTDVTVTDDKCGPVELLSGDTNADGKLDQGENWKYNCATTLSTTTTNTAVVTGYSDDPHRQIAVATAIVTVAVDVPGLPNTGSLPPLINILKVPSRLTPFPYGGGLVTYTYTVTNPGVVALNNVSVTDDLCVSVFRISGDTNRNNLLDQSEAWTYTCSTNVPVSTRNIATARGTANGFITLGYAFATVLVSAPELPNTGSAQSAASPALYGIGDQIKTIREMNVRIGPGLDQYILDLGDKGDTGLILKGPMQKDGYTWWQIQYSHNLTGWTAGIGLTKQP